MGNKYRYRRGGIEKDFISKDSANHVYQGDFTKMSGGQAVVVGTSTDNLALKGIAMSYGPDSGVLAQEDIAIALTKSPGVFNVDLNTATTCQEGNKLAITAAPVAGSMTVTKTDTDAVMYCTESGNSLTKVDARFLTTQALELGDAT